MASRDHSLYIIKSVVVMVSTQDMFEAKRIAEKEELEKLILIYPPQPALEIVRYNLS